MQDVASHKIDYDVNSRIPVHTFQGVFGMINRKENITKLKFCKVMTVATLFLWQFGLRLIKTPGYIEQQR